MNIFSKAKKAVTGFFSSKFAKAGAVATTALVAVPAFATGPVAPDLNPVVEMIYSCITVISAIGMAVLSLYATVKVYKWVRGAF